MGKARILIVEDDFDISNMLRIFFSNQGYDVEVASSGPQAIEKTRQLLPHLIVLDIMLPGFDGYEVCQRLRTQPRTRHIPIIFLTQKDERSDKLQGLELGADDYITKPFDIEELKLRVQNAIARTERDSLTDPRSGLPSGRLIEEQLRRIIHQPGWEFLDIRILHFDPFREAYGFLAANEVLRYLTLLMSEVVDEFGTPEDFIGHPGDDNFIIITTEEAGPEIRQQLQKRFTESILSHYNFMDRERGHLLVTDSEGKTREYPFMSLSIGHVASSSYTFTDIREITTMAAEARRKATPSPGKGD